MTAPKPSALSKVLSRATKISAQDAEGFPADHFDMLMAEAMLSPGVINYQDIAAWCEMPVSTVKERLQNDLRAAWIARVVSNKIESRLGMVLGAVYARAMRTGDVNAAKLLLTQYGALVQPVAQTEHRHLHLDLSALSADELKAFIAERQKTLGTDPRPGTTVDGSIPAGRREADPMPPTPADYTVLPSTDPPPA